MHILRPPQKQLWERGLLAKAVGQSTSMLLIHRLREQARSHMGFEATSTQQHLGPPLPP